MMLYREMDDMESMEEEEMMNESIDSRSADPSSQPALSSGWFLFSSYDSIVMFEDRKGDRDNLVVDQMYSGDCCLFSLNTIFII